MNTAEVTSSGEFVSTDTPTASDMIMFVQLRPSFTARDKCLAALERLAFTHPGVDFTIAGIGKDARYLRIILAINLGAIDQIAKFSPQSQAGYAFVAALFTDLFDFLPQYIPGVTAEERAAAEAILAARPLDTAASTSSDGLNPRQPQPANTHVTASAI